MGADPFPDELLANKLPAWASAFTRRSQSSSVQPHKSAISAARSSSGSCPMAALISCTVLMVGITRWDTPIGKPHLDRRFVYDRDPKRDRF
jgi:hypothetical protein